MKVVVTGANGFIGKNLVAHLQAKKDVVVTPIDINNTLEDLRKALKTADVVYHLAGVNRAKVESEFESGNAGFTQTLCDTLRDLHRTPRVVMSSSIQAESDTPYGVSKRHAEEILTKFGTETGADTQIYRLKNVFGKWCRPGYNSVIATFCHNIANGLPIQISDKDHKVDFVYVDDVVSELINRSTRDIPYTTVTLGYLANKIQEFHDLKPAEIPDLSNRFLKQLYATYLSYVPTSALPRQLDIKSDQRGELTEFIKSRFSGQVFLSRTKPGVTRGNHYHHTKTERFLVIEGEGLIRLRSVIDSAIIEYRVRGEDLQSISIPPGYTHSITNVGDRDLVTLFWADESFDPERPDTTLLDVSCGTPKVSIVITTFNRPNQLNNTLESITRQSYKDYEIVVIDDGTDDETPNICKKFGARYTRVNRPQSSKYRNPAVPLNMGVRQAKGDIVILQNAECKHVDPETIQKLSSAVTDTNAVFARVVPLAENGGPVTAYPLYCGRENPRPLFFCGAIKRSWFEKLRGFDEDFVEVCYEDDDFADRLKKEGVTWVFTDVLVHHQWHPYLGHFYDAPSKALYIQKSALMASGRLGTIRNLGREWGVVSTSSPPTEPPVTKPVVPAKPPETQTEPTPKPRSSRYGRDTCTMDWWATHPRK